MKVLGIILLCILVLLIVAIIGLYIFGKKQQKKQAGQQEQIKAMAQHISLLVIDKKRLRLKNAGFPAVVLENTPKLLRNAKVSVVKAKVGPRIMTFMCDEKVFPLVPLKKEIKAVVSGIYITEVKGIRGTLEAPQKKKGLFRRKK